MLAVPLLNVLLVLCYRKHQGKVQTLLFKKEQTTFCISYLRTLAWDHCLDEGLRFGPVGEGA